ncbi:MAG: c-type cytochrome [Proteobacteria bacterium]|nr:hypothetical protein [Pseudomonadota bacterium]NOG60974.1 c-type cytochrome [Pseudomonadota bacterium]
MFKIFRNNLFLIAVTGFLLACSDSDTPQEKSMAKVTEEKAVQVIADEPVAAIEDTSVAEAMPANTETGVADVMEKAESALEEVKKEVVDLAESANEEMAAVASDKPYQLIDGVISNNAIEGWKTYNGGGCGACHGKGGIGAVGPNLGNSVTQKLSKEEFVNIVTNGKSGTLMRPNKTNKRVMDNMDNLYAYLVARGDDVLGPGNLIKLPLGK